MAKTDFKSVDEYLATLPDDTRKVLDQVRAIIRKTLPEADEVISYQIPAYKIDGVPVIYFSGWKDHFSLNPVGVDFVDVLPEQAKKHVAGKSTLKFPLKDGVPEALIVELTKLRKKAAAEEAKAKAAKKRGK